MKRLAVSGSTGSPPQIMVAYDVPDNLSSRDVSLDDLPLDWAERETYTQALGNAWLDGTAEALLFVPSVVMPIADTTDRNVLINHRVAAAATIRIARTDAFSLDPRLFNP